MKQINRIEKESVFYLFEVRKARLTYIFGILNNLCRNNVKLIFD